MTCIPLLAACCLLLAGCVVGSTPAPAVPEAWLYRLDREPTSEDWRVVPPTRVTARGGAMVDPGLAYRMDQSLTHQANADCHHGPSAGASITVAVAGFWSPESVWLRVVWEDRTTNDAFRAWRRSPSGWSPTGEKEDGVAVAWGEQGFPCHQACHLADWEFSQGSWVPRYAMVSPTDPVPFWLWRAFRGGIYHQAETGWLGPDKVNVSPGSPRFDYNSVSGRQDRPKAFTDKDRPAATSGGGETLAGVLPVRPAARDAVATESIRNGRNWEVTMRRPLTVGEKEGISLDPAKGAVIGIALFDDSLTDHHIVQEPLRLVFLPAAKEVSR
jgi:hypothetical protein